MLLVVAVTALAAMLVACSLPQPADRAQELYKQSLARQGQAAQQASTAARERGATSDASAHIVLLSIFILTMVEVDMWSVADRQQFASLHTGQQQHSSDSDSQNAAYSMRCARPVFM